jgi:hypothetical protein
MSKAGSPLEALKGGFRSACVKRLVGDENGAIQVLKNEIPLLVVAWAKTSSLEPGEKKAKLKEMFDDESARAEELAVAFDLFAGRFEARVASRVQEALGEVVQRIDELTKKLEHSASTVGSKGAKGGEVSKEIKETKSKNEGVEIEEVAGPAPTIDESDLDPPSGTGLKFDEIEEMIDNLLSTGNS